MPICKKCNKQFPNLTEINGKFHNLHSRKFCLECSPFGLHNTKDLITNIEGYKKCPKCGEMLEISMFYIRSDREQQPSSFCKKCIHQQTIERQRKLKELSIEYKGGMCIICGYHKYNGSLEFHHLDPLKKDFCISKCHFTNFEKIKKELDKCVLVCSNCHKEIHGNVASVAGLEPASSNYGNQD